MKHATSWLALLLVFCLTLPSGLTAAAAKQGETAQEQTFTITVGQSFQDADGNALGTAFLDSNSRMLVPLRALAEQMELIDHLGCGTPYRCLYRDTGGQYAADRGLLYSRQQPLHHHC